MYFKKIRKITVLMLLFALIFPGFLVPFQNVKADANKKIIITFATTPTTPTTVKAELKYNKKFAYSYSYDDGLISGYDPAFTYMNGGHSSYLGQDFGGLYFTDGAGNNVPFRGGYAFYTRNSSYSDIHINTPSYINWTQLQNASDYGWDIFNHGYTSATASGNETYYIGDPGGHAQGPLDYNYELTQAGVDVASHINLKNNAGVSVGAFNMSQVILPNGDQHYTQPAFDIGYNAVYAQSPTFIFDGSTTTAPASTKVNGIGISSNRHVMPRWFDYETRYLSGGEFSGGLFNKVDEVATLSSGTDRYWKQEFTHQITTSTNPPDWNGGITWTSWKSLMDHIENTYGRFGDDSIWVAGAQEVYDYMMVKQNTVITQNLVGNQLTVEINTTNVPANLKHYALSLLVNSNATISSISYGTDFTYHTDNKTTGLINVDWGVNSYSKNDITRADELVTKAETTHSLSSINAAQIFVNLLSATQQAAQKTSYNARLDAIVVPLRTWYVDVKGISTLINCNDSNGATTTKAYAPSIYNWNLFTMGNTSAISCGDLINLKDSDNQISSLSLSNTAPFKSGGLGGHTSGNNTGLYPDKVITENVQIYSSTTTPAKFKIYGLESMKTYNIKLFGSTSATGATGNSAITLYTIGGQTKELIVKTNLNNSVEFLDVLPVGGEIEVTVAPKVASWGYGFLNAFEIKENLLAAPSSLSYSSPNVYTKNNTIAQLSPTVTGQGITYSVFPSLPTGLSFNTSTGVISGTPTVVIDNFNYLVTASNTGGSTTFNIAMKVNDIAPSSLSYASPMVYTKGLTITPIAPTVSGGAVILYSASPALPDGLYLNSNTGVISGTPTSTAGLNTYTITANNSGGSNTFGLVLTVNEAAPINFSYINPSAYTKNTAITSLAPTITGSNITYSISPTLPTGLNFATSTGIISGTPTVTSASSTYTVTASNSGGNVNATLSITINEPAPISLSYISPSSYTKNSVITPLVPTISGSNVVYSISPALPTGLSIDSSTGIISGTPTIVSGSAIYTVTATNTGGNITFGVVIIINDIAPTNLSYTSPNDFQVNTIIQALSPTNSGGSVLSYSISPALPTGLAFNTSTGVISGTPTVMTGAVNYTVTATNSGGSATFQLSIIIDDDSAYAISYNSPQVYIKGITISPLSPINPDQEIISYSVSPALPAGLTLNTFTGVISGTPSAITGIYTYTVTANELAGIYATFGLVITVNDVAPVNLSYTSPNIYTKNSIITPFSPAVTGQVISYSISPSLPSGLIINYSTGIISGTPVATSSLTTYTVTATNTGGNTTYGVVITVKDDAVITYNLSYLAGQNGSISGQSNQTINQGDSATLVTAIPNAGYHFVNWSDNSTVNPRTDLNINSNLNISANFAINISSGSSPVSTISGIGDGSRNVSAQAVTIGSTVNVGEVTNSGVNVLTYITNNNNFSAPESSNNWQINNHLFKITDLNLDTNIATITFYSDPKIITLKKGETKNVDLDSDGINDIEVKFTNIYVNLAEITIKSLDKQSLILPVTNNNQDVVAQELALTKVINKTLSKRLSGKILLQVETRGQAWYLDPVSLKRFYLADGLSAYQALRQFGLGITNNDLNKIPVAPTSVLPLDYKTSKNYSNSLVNRLKGRIVLQVENRGEAWYINPANGYKYYLANGEEAYKIMRNLSLGISNENIQSIAVGLNY